MLTITIDALLVVALILTNIHIGILSKKISRHSRILKDIVLLDKNETK